MNLRTIAKIGLGVVAGLWIAPRVARLVAPGEAARLDSERLDRERAERIREAARQAAQGAKA